MGDRAILYPLLAQALLAFVVGVVMFRRRVAEMRANRVHPQAVALSRDMAAKLADQRAPDSFRNQFELPVLFYALLLALYVTKLADPLYVGLAWIFVTTRYAHAWIHCTFNKVMRRFQAYAVGYFVLAAMWARFAFDLLVAR
jgi:hypothetical protein